MEVNNLFEYEKFNFLNNDEKQFIINFNDGMTKIGYINDGIQNYVVLASIRLSITKRGSRQKKLLRGFIFVMEMKKLPQDGTGMA